MRKHSLRGFALVLSFRVAVLIPAFEQRAIQLRHASNHLNATALLSVFGSVSLHLLWLAARQQKGKASKSKQRP